MLDKKKIIVGYSGHAYVVGDAFLSKGNSLHYYTAKNKSIVDPFNLEYLGYEEDENFPGWGMNLDYILGIGNNIVREVVGIKILEKNQNLLNVIHPIASISKFVEIGKGVFVSKGVMVNALVKINDFAILNTACVVEHECIIGKSAHIAPGAILAGNVQVGERAFVGANAVIKQGVIIGKNVIIGAGSVVLNNLPDNSIVYGNPAQQKKNEK